MPPVVDTCHFPPGPGNGCTTISERPDSFVSYATQRPSGENCPLDSSNGVFITTIGFRSLPVIGSKLGLIWNLARPSPGRSSALELNGECISSSRTSYFDSSSQCGVRG